MEKMKVKGVDCFLLPSDFIEQVASVIFDAHGGYSNTNPTATKYRELMETIRQRDFIIKGGVTMALVTTSELSELKREYNFLQKSVM